MSTLSWTELPDKYGKVMTAHSGTWSELVSHLSNAGTFPSKEKCPWIKGASFGTKSSAKGSLRNNENVTAVFVVEGDYDGGVMPLAAAARLLEKHGIKGAFYPSPSSTPDKPRWRVLCPLSQQHSPEAREGLVARLNGALGGVLAHESFTLSQGYYFGATPGNDYRVVSTFNDPLAGQCIDALPELDKGALGKQAIGKQRPTKDRSPNDDTDPFAGLVHQADPDSVRDLRSALTALRADDRTQWVDMGLALKTLGDRGRGLWLEWSQTSDKYDPQDAADKWESFKPKDISYQSVFVRAQGAGWLNPKSHTDSHRLVEQTTANVQRYKLLGADDLRNLPPLAWRVRGVLPAVGLAGLYGPSASGKSFLALDMAAAIAEGRRWFDCRVTAAPVVYCALEGEAGFKLRVAAWEQHKGRPLPDGLSMVLQPFTLTQAQDVADLAAAVMTAGRGAVVFLDTLNRAAPTADENSSKDMGAILQAAKTLQALTGGLVILVHHTGKDASRGVRGHSSLFAALDAAVEVSRDGERRDWKVAKSKDGADGGSKSFSLTVIDLGLDADGEDVSSCVVQPADVAEIQMKPLTPSQARGLDALTETLAADLFGTGVSRGVWKDAFYLRMGDAATDTKRTAFKRVIVDLKAQGRVYELNGLFSIPDF